MQKFKTIARGAALAALFSTSAWAGSSSVPMLMTASSGGGSSQTISSISPSSCTFTTGTSGNCSVTVTMSPSSPSFATDSGTLSLVSSGGSCSGTEDTTDFGVSNSPYQITYNGSAAAGTYHTCLQASASGISSAYQQVTITVSSSGITPPTAASNAGFTTLALNLDFTTSSAVSGIDGGTKFNAQTISNWLTCAGSGSFTATYPVFQVTQGPGNTIYPPCSDFSVINDGGTEVLDEKFTPSDYTAFYNNNPGDDGLFTTMSNCDNNAGNCAVSFPATFYVEFVDRVTQATVDDYSGVFTTMFDDWAWPVGSSGNEIDFLEAYSDGSGNSDGPAYGLSWSGTIPLTTYTSYGFLRTSDGSTDSVRCLFMNNTINVCGDEGTAVSFGQYMGLITIVGPAGKNRSQPANNMDHYVQRIRVWTCSNWKTSPCYGSSKSTSGGVTYWH